MKITVMVLLLAVVAVGTVVAAEPTATAVACTGVKDRAPEGAAEKFPVEVGQVYCFTEALSVAGTIVHVWFFGDTEVGRVELPVKAERWRTWSAKKVMPQQKGAWKVEVRDESGKVLATASFSVE